MISLMKKSYLPRENWFHLTHRTQPQINAPEQVTTAPVFVHTCSHPSLYERPHRISWLARSPRHAAAVTAHDGCQ